MSLINAMVALKQIIFDSAKTFANRTQISYTSAGTITFQLHDNEPGGVDYILDSAGQFAAQGFKQGDIVESTNSIHNSGKLFNVISVTATTMEVASLGTMVAEVGGVGAVTIVTPLASALYGFPGSSYTDEQAQDAVGSILQDTATVDMTYDDATPYIKADVKANSVDVTLMHATATDKLFGRSTAGAGAGEEIACTAAGRAILDDADAAAQRVTLGIYGYTLPVMAALTASVTAATYYYGGVAGQAMTTYAKYSRLYIPKTGVIKIASIFWSCAGGGGTNEKIETFIVEYLAADDSVVSATSVLALYNTYSTKQFNNFALSINVTGGNYLEIKTVIASHVSYPSNVSAGGSIYLEAA
jgi:hypothetical protein